MLLHLEHGVGLFTDAFTGVRVELCCLKQTGSKWISIDSWVNISYYCIYLSLHKLVSIKKLILNYIYLRQELGHSDIQQLSYFMKLLFGKIPVSSIRFLLRCTADTWKRLTNTPDRSSAPSTGCSCVSNIPPFHISISAFYPEHRSSPLPRRVAFKKLSFISPLYEGIEHICS